MLRTLSLSLSFSIICLLASGQEKTITAESKIQSVIVFLHGVQIERTADVRIPNGASTIIFKGLSPEIDEQSIQV